MFDFLIRSTDRGEENMIYNINDVWGIDNGASLRPNRLGSLLRFDVQELRVDQMSLGFIANIRATTPSIIREVLKDYPEQQVVEEIIIRREELLLKLTESPVSRH